MPDDEKADPDATAASSWELRHLGSDDASHGYFFDTDYKESSILNEFGWNIPAESSGCAGGFVDFHRIEPDLAASLGDDRVSADASAHRGDDDIGTSVEPLAVEDKASASPSNPSISSSSSEDPPDKSTASGVSSAAASNPPPDIASKTKQKGPKRIRQQRVSFVTKSDVDHLEDGYRWRKYGQKAVKNSPFPRSYYRCTNNKCIVKKRIERSSEDPSVVITTYEGQHCHLSAGYPRGGGGGGGALMAQEAAFPRYLIPSSSQFYHPRLPHMPPESSLSVGTQPSPNVPCGVGESHTAAEEASSRPPLVGEWLLGDIVPPRMRNG